MRPYRLNGNDTAFSARLASRRALIRPRPVILKEWKHLIHEAHLPPLVESGKMHSKGYRL